MVHVSRTFTVNRPVADVVAYLADFTNAEEWDPGTQTCVRLDAGPVRAGSTWRNVSKVLGRKTELMYRLDRLDPDHLTFVGTNKTATSTDDITVKPTADGRSEITYHARIELHGAAKLGEPVLKLEFERLGRETVKGITNAVSKF